MVLMSIIIPVYNVEKYLVECIESVINQNLRDIEIILVNDGSTDNSLALCKEYADVYDFISVYNKTNGGLSDARNYGLKKCSGEYVIFIDSDDTLEKHFLEKISQKMRKNNADIIVYKHKKYYQQTKAYKYDRVPFDTDKILNQPKEKVIRYLIEQNQFEASACLKAVKREIIIENNIYFTKGIYCEDIDWSLNLLGYVNTFDCMNEWAYIYRQQREGSITNALSYKNLSDLMGVIEKWFEFYRFNDANISSTIVGYLAYQYCIVMGQCNNLTKDQKIIIKNRLIKLEHILSFGKDKKTKLVKIIRRLVGIRYSMWVLNIFIKIKNKGLI